MAFAIWNRTDDLTLINGVVMSPGEVKLAYPMTIIGTVVLELTADGRVGGFDTLQEMAARLGVLEGDTDADTLAAVELEMLRIRDSNYDSVEALLSDIIDSLESETM